MNVNETSGVIVDAAIKVQKENDMKKSNFDSYLEQQMQDPEFAARFNRAGEAWDVALQS